MKSTRLAVPIFMPLVVTFESQAEIDVIKGILDFNPISIALGKKHERQLDKLLHALSKHSSPQAYQIHGRMANKLKDAI